MSGRGGGGGKTNGGTNNDNSNDNLNDNNNGNNNGKEEEEEELIPVGARKVVEIVKEIVSNFSDSEIYAALEDSNMDPNEAVHLLLSQDPFHEVKSKREKKREKDTTKTRSRVFSDAVHRSGRGGSDHYGRYVSSQYSSNDSRVWHAKPAHRKDNDANAYAGSPSSSSDVAGSSINWQPLSHSDCAATESKISRAPGQVSMADVVKMGRPPNKASALPHHYGIPFQLVPESASLALDNGLNFREYCVSNISERSSEPEFTFNDNFHVDNEWPSIEQPPAVSVPSVLDVSGDTELYLDSSHLDGGHHQIQPQIESVQSTESHALTTNRSSIRRAQRVMKTHAHIHSFDHDSDEDGASRVAANLQQLSLQNDGQRLAHEEENPTVVIPYHLQVRSHDFSHLSFGSLGADIDSTLSGSFSMNILKNTLEETSQVVDGPSAGLSDARSTLDENLRHGTGMRSSTYDSIPVHQPEIPKEEIPWPSHESQYVFPPSATESPYESSQQLNAGFNDTQTSSQMPNVVPFSGAKSYSNLLPSSLLASTAQSGRESDLSYSPFDVMESLVTKHRNMASSITGLTISMSEALRASNISSIQSAQRTPAGANIATGATGPTLPQQLSTHPHSQPRLPLGASANMAGYPFSLQSSMYLPSTFQQNFAGNSTYHQSLAAKLQQYMNNVSVSSLPQSAVVASGYGFGSSNNVPGSNFPLNPPTASTGTTLVYDDLLSSQYKEGGHLISSVQRNENPALRVHQLGSRTMSGVPGSAYYSFQGQNQQAAQFRQAQRQSQQSVPPVYQDYHQMAQLLERQQQNSRDGPF